MDAWPQTSSQSARQRADECPVRRTATDGPGDHLAASAGPLTGPERAQGTAPGLTPDDIEAIAQRVRELVRKDLLPARFVDAATLAHHLGVDRDWVYAHASELGAIRLGGPCGRLRFDLQHTTRKLAEDATGAPARHPGVRRRAGRHRQPATVELIPYERQ
jgi:hypothetical protein